MLLDVLGDEFDGVLGCDYFSAYRKYMFVNHFESFFTFITTPGVDPTNNLAEQAIRFVAIHRRMTQGTRSESGRTWCERIWTAVVTCEQQGRSLFDYLCETVGCHFQSHPTPSLVGSDSS